MRRKLLIPLCLLLTASLAHAGKPLEHFETYPAFGFQVFQTPDQWKANLDSIIMSFSVNAVTDRSALTLSFPDDPGVPGRIVRANTLANFEGSKAISFWVRGDGSRNYGIISLAQKVDAPKARFYLRDKKWRQVIIPWDRFRPWTSGAPLLSFGLSPEATRPSWYIIDKIEAVDYTRPSDDDIKLAAAANSLTFPDDPALPETLERYVAYTNFLSTARLDLKAKKPMTILVLGDLIARGEKLYNVDVDDNVQALYRYPAVLGRLLAEKYGYDAKPVVSENFRGSTAREVVSFGGLRIINFGKDIKSTEAPARLKRQLDAEKPTLVIIQLGSTDAVAASTDAMQKAYAQCITLLKEAKVNCILVTNPPGYFRTKEEEPFAAQVRLLARDNHVALVDARKLFTTLPSNGWSVYFLDRNIPNYMGHRLIAQALVEALK